MHRQFQGANKDCNTCGRRLLGEFSGLDITWGNAVYRIREFLGGGGMGEVYRAIEQDHAQTFSRESAVKFNKNMMDPDVVKRFQLEVQILNLLQNPHNIRVYNYGELYEQRATGMEVRAQFMVMELLQGQPLNEITKLGAMDHREALPIFIQVCSALSEAHQKGVIHRDLKPHNIMLQDVGGDRFAKVFDFGLSRLTTNMDDRLSTTGVVMGTFRYMSPEQALGEDCDHRTDIFSLGVVLYEILNGQHPFPAKNLFELFTLHQQGPPPMEIAPELQAIVNKSLAYEQDKRYQSVDEFRADMQLALGDSMSGGSINTSQILAMREVMEQQAIALDQSQSQPQHEHDSGGSRQSALIAMVAVLVIAVGLGGFFMLPKGDPPIPPPENRNTVGKTNGNNSPNPSRLVIKRRKVEPRRKNPPMVRYRRPEPVVRRVAKRRRITRRRRRRRRYFRRRRRRRRVIRRQPVVQVRPRDVVVRRAAPRPIRRRPVMIIPRRRPVRVAMVRRVAPRPRIVAPPPPRCPSQSRNITYGQLDKVLGRTLNTRISRYINKAAKETIYDAGLRLSQSWKRSPVICKRSYMRRKILNVMRIYCRRYRPGRTCRGYRAVSTGSGSRTVFRCKK